MSSEEIRIIRSDAGLIARTVNAGMTLLNRRIGKRIQSEILGDERAGYGKKIVSTL